MEWKDETSYSRTDKNRVPRVLGAKVDGLRIVIHRIIHSDGWFLTVHELNLDDCYLNTENIEEAKNKGIQILITKIEELESIKNILINEFNRYQSKQS